MQVARDASKRVTGARKRVQEVERVLVGRKWIQVGLDPFPSVEKECWWIQVGRKWVLVAGDA